MKLPKTEMRNPASMHMDTMSSIDMALLIIRANYEAVKACEDAALQISSAIDAIANAFNNGNRLFYVGAGTSGRIGILDASECPPTFGVPYDQVQALIAGGDKNIYRAGEIAEDSYEDGCEAVKVGGASAGDIVVGISAAGNAAYVVGAMETAKKLGCITIGITCNEDTLVQKIADIRIFTDTGAEVLTGSTRLKAGTAQKIVLNTLTTCAMAKTGKVYENMMINLIPSNEKLRGRVIRIVSEILACNEADATKMLEENNWVIRDTVEAAKKRQVRSYANGFVYKYWE